MKIYRCNLCGNMMMVMDDGGVNPVCCNTNMELLIPREDEMLLEKHVPIVTVECDKVMVKIPHVSETNHYIEAIILETNKGTYIKYFRPTEKPEAEFMLDKSEELIACYEYCNIHRLFKKDLQDEAKQDC